MTYFVVDRIEKDIAVCEDNSGNVMALKKSELPDEIKEGSVLQKDSEGKYYLNLELENKFRKEIIHLQESIFGNE